LRKDGYLKMTTDKPVTAPEHLSRMEIAEEMSDLEIAGYGDNQAWWEYTRERHIKTAEIALQAIASLGYIVVRKQ
jgi:hypothetical protein